VLRIIPDPGSFSAIEKMKLKVLICLICLVTLLAGCRKSSQTNGTNSNGVAGTGGRTEDHTQAVTLLEKGKELYRTDRDREAVEAFLEALKLNPDLAEAHFLLALSYEALNKQHEAEAEYKKAIEGYKKYLEDNPNDAEAYYNLGQSYAGLHLYSEAVREYRQAVKLKPDDADIYYDLGTALTKLAQYDEAVSAFSKSLEIDPDNYRAQDALDEAKEGVDRIRAGKKHQADLLKKQQEEELKKGTADGPASSPTKPNVPTKPE
jgi:tetratricopeptide (TPR) repeat protein